MRLRVGVRIGDLSISLDVASDIDKAGEAEVDADAVSTRNDESCFCLANIRNARHNE